MAEDRWGTPIRADFTWACRDEDLAATDSCLSVRIGPEFRDHMDARFYEDNLPELRSFVALLARLMTLQEKGAVGHGRSTTENADWLREELGRLLEALPDA